MRDNRSGAAAWQMPRKYHRSVRNPKRYQGFAVRAASKRVRAARLLNTSPILRRSPPEAVHRHRPVTYHGSHQCVWQTWGFQCGMKWAIKRADRKAAIPTSVPACFRETVSISGPASSGSTSSMASSRS